MGEEPKKSALYKEFGALLFGKIGKFIQMQKDKGVDIAAINFGVSVGEWLKWHEKPTFATFKDELVDKIGIDLFNEYKAKCMALLQLLGNDRWTLKELMSLKVYTDTTELCKLFRYVHWESESDKNKN